MQTAGFIDYESRTYQGIEHIEVHISDRPITTSNLSATVRAFNELIESGKKFIVCAHIPDSKESVQRFAGRYGFRRWYKTRRNCTIWGVYRV